MDHNLNQHNLSFLLGQRLRMVCFSFCALFFAYFTSVLISKTQNITFGFLGRLFFYCLVAAFLLLIVNNLKLSHIKKAFAFPSLQKFNFFIVIMVLTIVSPNLIGEFEKFSSLITIVSVFVIGSAVLSIFLILKNKLFKAIILFIFNLPLLRLLEWEFGKTTFEWVISGPLVFTPTILYLAAMFLSYLLSYKKDKNIELSSILASVLILLTATIISIFVSNDLFSSLKIFLFAFFYPMVFFYLTLKGLRSIEQVKILLFSLIAVGIIYSFFGYYSILGMSIPTLDNLYLLYGELGLAQAMRIIAVFLLPFTVALALINSGIKRAGLIIAASLELIFTVASFSRIALLAAACTFIPFLTKKQIKTLVVLGLFLFILFQGWFMQNIFVRFSFFDSLEKLDMFYWSPMRLWGIRGALSIIKNQPIFGVGYGMWEDYYYRYGPALYIGKDILYIRAAHNTFLDMAVQGGMLLLAGLAAFLFAFFKEGMSLIYSTKDEFIKNMALGCMGFLISIIVISFAGNVFSFAINNDITIGVVFWSIVAVLFTLRRIDRAQKDAQLKIC